MKRSTAVRHLREMAATATGMMRLRESEIGWPLEELWIAGELLTGAQDIEVGAVVLLLDVALPWLATHPTGDWVGDHLRLGKRPFHWFYRPAVWPAWNPAHRRVIRLWTAEAGLDQDAIDTAGRARAIATPSPAEMAEQFQMELAVSRRHLHEVLDRFWDPDWRSLHRSPGRAEDHLWRAAQGVRELEEAIEANP
ncbi:MAG: DUF7711 family protein [Acidimicrobiales bacterium]